MRPTLSARKLFKANNKFFKPRKGKLMTNYIILYLGGAVPATKEEERVELNGKRGQKGLVMLL